MKTGFLARRWWPRPTFVAGVLAAMLASCGGGEPTQPSGTTLVFRIRGEPPSQEFRYVTSSPALIAQAREQLALPVERRSLFASGAIAAGNGGGTSPTSRWWSWPSSCAMADRA